jgi:hypothetical protein
LNIKDLNDLGLDLDLPFVSEVEKDDLINRLSDDIIVENIKEQLSKPVLSDLSTVNYLDILDTRFAVLSDKYSENEDLMEIFKAIRLDIYNTVATGIEEKFDVKLNFDLSFMAESDYFYNVEKLYQFFIINYKPNLVNFFVSHIMEHREALVKSYKKDTNKKDLEVSSLRKVIQRLDDVVVVYNIEDIIADIVQTEDPMEILNTVIENDPDELTNVIAKEIFVDQRFDSFLETGFCSKFFAPLISDEHRFVFVSDIKNNLIRLFPKK